MIVGDFIYHFDCSSLPHSLFKQLTDSLGLYQNVYFPSHASGNIIDLIFTPSDTTTFTSVCSHSDILTDHYLLYTSILLEKPSSTNSLINYRNFKDLKYIDIGSRISYLLWNTNVSFDNLNVCLSSSLNALSPITSSYFTLHPSFPWFTSHLAIVQRSLRKLERWIHLSPFHKLKYLMVRKVYKLELNQQKTIYYEQKLNYCGIDSHTICKMVISILGTNIKSKYTALPDSVLCSSFVNCLSTKISRISDCISSKLAQSPLHVKAYITSIPISYTFFSFIPHSITEIRNLILSANSIYPIHPLLLVVFKNLVYTIELTILYLISSLNHLIMALL